MDTIFFHFCIRVWVWKRYAEAFRLKLCGSEWTPAERHECKACGSAEFQNLMKWRSSVWTEKQVVTESIAADRNTLIIFNQLNFCRTMKL